MFKWISRKLTNNYKEVPLLSVTFDLNHYKEFGKQYSCVVSCHPYLKGDEYIRDTLGKLIDHIRDGYDLEDLSK